MYEKILTKHLRSDDMVNYLKDEDVTDDEIMTIICSSPLSLNDKINSLMELKNEAKSQNNEKLLKYISDSSDLYNLCINHLSSDGVFLIKVHEYDGNVSKITERFGTLCLSYKQSMEWIVEDDRWYEPDDYHWCEIDKWDKDVNGVLYQSASFMVFNQEIYYCDLERSSINKSWFLPYHELRVKVPFKPGDILEIDRYPFGPKIHVLTINIGDNVDCCSFQVLSYDVDENNWYIGGARHDNIGNLVHTNISPLFSTKIYHGKLNDDEKFMIKLGDYIKKNPHLIDKIWSYISLNNMTTEEITTWVDKGCPIQ